jgi:hypothetical protein
MLLDAESEARRAVQVADQSGAVRERSLTRLTLSRVLTVAGRRESAEAVLNEIVGILENGATPLEDLIGEGTAIPMLLHSPAIDLSREFSDRRVEAPHIEWQTMLLEARVSPTDAALEPLRVAAGALTRLLAGLSAEDAIRYGKANPDAEVLYTEFGRLAVTEEDRRQLRMLSERASSFGDSQNGTLAAISGKS